MTDPALPLPAAWRRRTRGEHRWPASLAVVVAIVLQLVLPERAVPEFRYALPVLELLLVGALLVADPFRIDRESRALRGAGLVLSGLVGVSNGWSAALLVADLVSGAPTGPAELLLAGAGVWLTNVIAFALLYWELDRGGPAARAGAVRDRPDLLFPQMQDPELAEPDWEPTFTDYLYVSFTNCTAFSPTDVLPLSHWAKLSMMVQSAIAFVVVALVIARAVNVLA